MNVATVSTTRKSSAIWLLILQKLTWFLMPLTQQLCALTSTSPECLHNPLVAGQINPLVNGQRSKMAVMMPMKKMPVYLIATLTFCEH